MNFVILSKRISQPKRYRGDTIQGWI